MTVGATLVASLLVALARPATWPLALAAFLVRGGFVLVLAPIIVLPSAVELGNLLSPLLTTLLFRGMTTAIVVLQAAAVVGLVVWLLGGGLIAAVAESELVRRIAADDDSWLAGGRPAAYVPAAHPSRRVLAVRLLAHLPLLLALPWSVYRFVVVAYDELTLPSDVALPVALRIVLGAPEALSVLLAAWLFGESVGALAARRVILRGDGLRRALGWAVVRVARRPVRSAGLTLVPLVPLVLVLIIVGMAGSATWDALRAALSLGDERLLAIALVLALVALFAGGSLLVGVTAAWRAAIWTIEVAGTFGAIGHGPEGQWNGVTDSGTLTDLRPRGVDPDTR